MLSVVGDVHGQYEKLARLLRDAELIDDDGRWSGGTADLWFLGDYFNRGPDGIAAVDLIMRLQAEAPENGGSVGALLGNHDLLILSAHYLGDHPSGGPGGTFHDDWIRNGGSPSDLARLEERHIAWLRQLPAMAVVSGHLLVHADALFYRDYGESIDSLNHSFQYILSEPDAEAWDHLLYRFGERRDYLDKKKGEERAERMMQQYGGRRIVHGHTPITKVSGEPAASIRQAMIYAGGRCVNTDHGLYLGGSGFVTRLEPLAG